LLRLPNGQVLFGGEKELGPIVGIVKRSGTIVTNDLPVQNGTSTYYGINGSAVGGDGNVWITTGARDIVRLSGLDSSSGGLDNQHRPKNQPDQS
jgi:hypothetical protein